MTPRSTVLRAVESIKAELRDRLEEFRQHLGGRLTLTMLRNVGDPVDVHEIDDDLMRRAIGRLKEFGPPTQRTTKRLGELNRR